MSRTPANADNSQLNSGTLHATRLGCRSHLLSNTNLICTRVPKNLIQIVWPIHVARQGGKMYCITSDYPT